MKSLLLSPVNTQNRWVDKRHTYRNITIKPRILCIGNYGLCVDTESMTNRKNNHADSQKSIKFCGSTTNYQAI